MIHEIDAQGRVNLSRRALFGDDPNPSPTPRPESPRTGGFDRGPRDNRGPRPNGFDRGPRDNRGGPPNAARRSGPPGQQRSGGRPPSGPGGPNRRFDGGNPRRRPLAVRLAGWTSRAGKMNVSTPLGREVN